LIYIYSIGSCSSSLPQNVQTALTIFPEAVDSRYARSTALRN